MNDLRKNLQGHTYGICIETGNKCCSSEEPNKAGSHIALMTESADFNGIAEELGRLGAKVCIRRLESGDTARILDIAAAAWEPIYDGYREQLGDELFEAFYHDFRERKRRNVQNDIQEGNCLVALIDEKVVGFASYTMEGKIGEIKANAVCPQWGGHGIGSMLQNRVLEELRMAGCRFAIVETGLDDAHAPARRAYQKNGFEKSLASVKYFQKL